MLLGTPDSLADGPASAAEWLKRLRSRKRGDQSCFVCRVVEACDDRGLHALLVAVPEVPEHAREITELCSHHASRLVDLSGGEPLRIAATGTILSAQADRARLRLAEWRVRREGGFPVPRWLGRLAWMPRRSAERIRQSACRPCRQLERDERAAIASLSLALDEADVRAELRNAELPCWSHLQQIRAAAPPRSAAWVGEWTLRQLDQLTAQLNDYIRKCDWNHRDEPHGAEQISPLQALHLLAGAPMLAPWRARVRACD